MIKFTEVFEDDEMFDTCEDSDEMLDRLCNDGYTEIESNCRDDSDASSMSTCEVIKAINSGKIEILHLTIDEMNYIFAR
jgi:hypothetical protein